MPGKMEEAQGRVPQAVQGCRKNHNQYAGVHTNISEKTSNNKTKKRSR